MGQRGPAPQPSALRLLRGNPSKRPVNRAEPKPLEKSPACPEYVKSDPAAAKEWRRLIPILKRMRVLTEADGTVLASLCLTHSHKLANLEAMRNLNRISADQSARRGSDAGATACQKGDSETDKESGIAGVAGMVIATKTGYLAMNQIYANVQHAIAQELKLCREFGLTPSSRASVQVVSDSPKSSDPWAALG